MSRMESRATGRSWITWSSLGLGATGLGQLALLFTLARILGSEDFGVVTAALVVVGIGRVAHACIGPALVQRASISDEHIRAAQALALAVGVVMTLLVMGLAPVASAFFRVDALTPVLCGMALLHLVQAPAVAPEALLQREMRLKELAIAEALSVAVGGLPFGIGLAVLDCGPWALVGSQLAQSGVKTFALLWIHPTPFAWRASAQALREVARYSSGVFLAGLCNYAASQGDNAVIGRVMPASALGVYGRAYQLMAMPAMFLGEVADRIVFPLLSRVQGDREQLRRAYARGVAITASMMAPTAALCVVLADEMVLVALGTGWDEAIPCFAALSFGLIFRTGYKLSDMLARATGTVYARAWRQAVFAMLLVAFAALGSMFGIVGVAWGVVAALLVNYALMAWLSNETTGLPWREFAALHARGVGLAGIVAAPAYVTAAWLRSIGASPLATLLLALLAAGSVLCACVRWSPRRVLGADGEWLWRTVSGRA